MVVFSAERRQKRQMSDSRFRQSNGEGDASEAIVSLAISSGWGQTLRDVSISTGWDLNFFFFFPPFPPVRLFLSPPPFPDLSIFQFSPCALMFRLFPSLPSPFSSCRLLPSSFRLFPLPPAPPLFASCLLCPAPNVSHPFCRLQQAAAGGEARPKKVKAKVTRVGGGQKWHDPVLDEFGKGMSVRGLLPSSLVSDKSPAFLARLLPFPAFLFLFFFYGSSGAFGALLAAAPIWKGVGYAQSEVVVRHSQLISPACYQGRGHIGTTITLSHWVSCRVMHSYH